MLTVNATTKILQLFLLLNHKVVWSVWFNYFISGWNVCHVSKWYQSGDVWCWWHWHWHRWQPIISISSRHNCQVTTIIYKFSSFCLVNILRNKYYFFLFHYIIWEQRSTIKCVKTRVILTLSGMKILTDSINYLNFHSSSHVISWHMCHMV